MYKIRKRILAFFLLTIMTFGFVGQGQVAVQAAGATGSTGVTLGRIKLEAYNVLSKSPIAGVEFSVVDSTGKIIATPITSSLGNVVIDVPMGTYKVKQTKVPTGYKLNTAVQTLTLWGSASASATYYNQSTETPTEPVAQIGQMRVSAYDISTGMAIGGVEFSVVDTTGKVVATLITNSSGEARANLLAGWYQVKQTKTPGDYSLNGSIQTVSIWPNSISTVTFCNQRVQIELGQLKVKVYDVVSGAALAGAEMTVADATGKVVSEVITNQNGEALLNLPAGSYNVKQTKAPSGYTVYTPTQFVTIWRNSMTTLAIYNQKAQPEIGQLKIKLQDAVSKEALAGGEFTIVDTSGKIVKTITTVANGEGQTDLSVGSYQVKQTKAPSGYTSSTAVQSFTISRGGLITSTFSNQKVLPDTGQIKVRAYDVSGATPLAGGEFSIVDTAGKVVATIVTNSKGEAVATLPAGSYRVQQTKAPMGYDINQTVQSVVVFRSGTALATFYNQKEQLATGQLKVSVYDTNSGNVLPGAEFAVLDLTGKVVTTLATNETGTMILNLAPGSYQVKQTKAPNGYDVNTTVQSFTISRGGTARVVFYNQKTPTNTGKIKVHVYDQDGITPLAGAEFLVLDANGKSVGSLQTSVNGEASIILPVGNYQLKETKAPEGYNLNSIIHSLTVSSNRTTSVAVYNQKTPPTTGNAIVRLYDEVSGGALAGAEFSFLDTTGKTVATLVTNKNGEGVVNIPVGSYRVKESKAPNGYQLNKAMKLIEIEPDGKTTVTFYNQKTPSMMGQLKVIIDDEETGGNIAGVELSVVDNEDKVVATLLTNQAGEATVNLPAGNYKIKETKVPAGYSIDTATQSVVVWKEGITTVTFSNQKLQTQTGLLKVKLSDMVGGSSLVGGEFAVQDMSGTLITTIVTNQAGEASIDLLPGKYQVKEVRAPEGYEMSTNTRSLSIWPNGSTTITFYNQKIQTDAGKLLIKKYDADGEYIVSGANFEVVDSTGKVIATPRTNSKGEVTVTLAPGEYTVRDASAVTFGIGKNSVMSVTITKGETQQVSFYNDVI